MTSEPFNRRTTPIGNTFRDGPPVSPSSNRPIVVVGVSVIISLLLVALSVLAGAFVVRTLRAASTGGGQGQIPTAAEVVAARQQSLGQQSADVEQRRAGIVAYTAKLTEFRGATARPAGAVGINLDAADARRREEALSVLVLECIHAVDRYNLAATALSVPQLRAAGLAERFVWPIDCTPAP